MSVTTLPASTGTSVAPHITVNRSALSTALTDALVELRVLLGVRTVGRCTLRFTVPGFTLATGSPFSIGAAVAVKARAAERGATLETLFSGIVTSVGLDQRAGSAPELVVVAQDKAWTLTHAAQTATFTQRSYDEMLKDLVTPLTLETQGLPGEQIDYLLRSGTALAYVDEIARRTGASWVVHEDTFHLWVGDATVAPSVTLAASTALHDFSVRVTDDVPDQVTVRGWDARQQTAFEATAPVPTDLPGSLSTLTGRLPRGRGNHVVADLGPVDPNEATVLAKAVAAGRGRVVARGKGPVRPDLRPGGTVQVREMGPANGGYPVREVEHVYTRTGFHTRFVAGDREPGPPVGAAGGGAATETASPGFRHAGLVVGTVARLSLDPGDRRLRTPATDHVMALVTLAGVDGRVTTDWARIATVGGGASSGVVFLPEIGDEVLVGFEGGDVRRPVVLGGLYSAKARMPDEMTTPNGTAPARRRIVSRRGHVVELGDGSTDAEEFIRLQLEGGEVSLRLGKDRTDLTMPDQKPIRIKAGSSFVELDGKGAIKAEGTTITLSATQKVTIEGAEVVLKGKQKVAASAAMVEIKAQAQATVEASGTTVIKGGMVQIN